MYSKPTNSEFGKIFDTVSEQYDTVFNHYVVTRRINFFKRFAKGKCLDVGAGTGEVSKSLNENFSVVATDISEGMVRELKKKGIEAVVCDAQRLLFNKESFDTIIGSELIYYLDNPSAFIKECKRVLKNDGLLLLSSANTTTQIYDKLRSLLRSLGFKHMYFDDQNRKFMSLSNIRSLLEKEGFRLIKHSKIILLPFSTFDWLNKILEQTPLSQFASFILVAAQKKSYG